MYWNSCSLLWPVNRSHSLPSICCLLCSGNGYVDKCLWGSSASRPCWHWPFCRFAFHCLSHSLEISNFMFFWLRAFGTQSSSLVDRGTSFLQSARNILARALFWGAVIMLVRPADIRFLTVCSLSLVIISFTGEFRFSNLCTFDLMCFSVHSF